VVLVMEEGHRREVEALAPALRGRVHRLGRFGAFDVHDPYRRGRPAF
jgi:protein-tyrosine phosphatase